MPTTDLFSERHDPRRVAEVMRTAEDWHNGPKSAMCRFGRHGCPPVQASKESPHEHALRFYRKLAHESARAIDDNVRGTKDGERLTALHEYANERVSEYEFLLSLKNFAAEAEDLFLAWVPARLKELSAALDRELEAPR